MSKEKLQDILSNKDDIAKVTENVTESIKYIEDLETKLEKLQTEQTQLNDKYLKTLEANQILVSNMGKAVDPKEKEKVEDDPLSDEDYEKAINELIK